MSEKEEPCPDCGKVHDTFRYDDAMARLLSRIERTAVEVQIAVAKAAAESGDHGDFIVFSVEALAMVASGIIRNIAHLTLNPGTAASAVRYINESMEEAVANFEAHAVVELPFDKLDDNAADAVQDAVATIRRTKMN